MDLKEIKALLEKYYSGDTSKEEEGILREYFSGRNVDQELIAEKDIFLYQIHEMNNSEQLQDISDEIWDKLQSDDRVKTKSNNKLIYISLRIAASIVIVLGSYFLIKNQAFNGKQKVMMVDTYDNPEIAYQQAKETLLYVSAMLNNGTNHLEPIHKVNKETEKLNTISNFNKGLNELRPIQKYNKAEKYFKQ